MEGKTNFFEKRVGEYGKMNDTIDEIKFDAEF
jgi:ribonucleoside-diphosphate reductase subunit M2